jgi:hypothetical protein
MSQAENPNTTNLSTLSRRTVLAGLSIAAAPAAAAVDNLVAGDADPIFALIAEHRGACATLRNAEALVERLEAELPPDASPYDTPSFDAGTYQGHDLICQTQEEFFKACMLIVIERKITIENTHPAFKAEILELQAAFNEELARCERGKAWRTEHGVEEARDARSRAFTALDQVTKTLIGLEPTTLAGLLEFLEYLSEFLGPDCWVLPDDWEQTAFATATASLRQIATA